MKKKYKDPKPDILRIEELVLAVKSGDIKLPKFQRPFVWTKTDIIKLWDSIYNGYPIGSILLWLTHEELASEREIADLEINQREEEYPTNYLLDGQQRLSTLCGPLFWKGNNKKSPWNIVFDLDSEKFVYHDGVDRVSLFPLNKLLDTRDFNKQCSAFEAAGEKADNYYENANQLLNSIKDYKIAAVKIGDMKLNEVAPIFERINSSGRQLTMVDLMRAATWKGGFDLNDAIKAIKEACEKKNFEDIKDTHILRSISACVGLGIHKEDIDKLRDCTSADLKLAASNSVVAYQLAVDFLTSELLLPSISYLPYALQLTYLVEYFNLNPTPDIHERVELKNWFWKTSFTGHFGRANTGLITRNLAYIRKFATKEIDKVPVEEKINFKGFVLDTFVLNKASSLTFALLLGEQKPLSLLNGGAVDLKRALAYTNKLEFHHIFPDAYLKKVGLSSTQRNHHANICMLNLTNNREISDSRPSEYFKEIEKRIGNQLETVLKSNFMNLNAFEAGLDNDYEKFIDIRKDLISEGIKKLVDKEVI
ncbi:MAG: DUF262 domain-containing protein [Bacteroidota bacterium]